MKFIPMAVLCFLLLGCSSPVVKTYEGGNTSIKELAVLTCKQAIEITAIDGDSSYSAYSGGGVLYKDCIVLLQPGEHSVSFKFNTGGGAVQMRSDVMTLSGEFLANGIYRIDYDASMLRWSPKLIRLDGDELERQRQRVSKQLSSN